MKRIVLGFCPNKAAEKLHACFKRVLRKEEITDADIISAVKAIEIKTTRKPSPIIKFKEVSTYKSTASCHCTVLFICFIFSYTAIYRPRDIVPRQVCGISFGVPWKPG